jgi:hypothetical protein
LREVDIDINVEVEVERRKDMNEETGRTKVSG